MVDANASANALGYSNSNMGSPAVVVIHLERQQLLGSMTQVPRYQMHPSAPDSFASTSSGYFVKSSSNTTSSLACISVPGGGRRDIAMTLDTSGFCSAWCSTCAPMRPVTPETTILSDMLVIGYPYPRGKFSRLCQQRAWLS